MAGAAPAHICAETRLTRYTLCAAQAAKRSRLACDNARPLQLTGGGGRAIGCKWDPWVALLSPPSAAAHVVASTAPRTGACVRAASHDARVTQVALQDNVADRVKDKLDVVRVGRARVVRVDLVRPRNQQLLNGNHKW